MDIDSHRFDRLRARVNGLERALATNNIFAKADDEHGPSTIAEIWGDVEKPSHTPAPDFGPVMQRIAGLERELSSLKAEFAEVRKSIAAPPPPNYLSRLQRHTTRLSGLESRLDTLETSHRATTNLFREQQAERDRNNTPSRLIDRILATKAPIQIVAVVETALNRGDLARAIEVVEEHEVSL